MRKKIIRTCSLIFFLLMMNIGLLMNSGAAYAADTWVWPTPSIPISSSNVSQPFGNGHEGIDIFGPLNTPIVAARDGTVCRVIHGDIPNVYYDAGNGVVIDHGGGIYSHYAHMNSTAVSEGQRVSAGTVIGYMGKTGRADGVHLHFAIATNSIGEGGRINNNIGVINYVLNTNNTITFDPVGGTSRPSPVQVSLNTSQNFAINGISGYAPSKPGSRFLGWYDSELNKIYDENGWAVPGKYWKLTGVSHPKECVWIYGGNVTAVAWWGNTITFDSLGGSWNNVTREVILNTPTYWGVGYPTKAGATFLGWYDADGYPIYDENGLAVPGKYWRAVNDAHTESLWIYTQNVTAYARWRYTISFDTQGGSGNFPELNVIYNAPEYWSTGYVTQKEGSTFLGWFDASGNQIYDASGKAVPGKYWKLTGSSSSPSECKWIYEGNVTAYAKWEENTHKHTYGDWKTVYVPTCTAEGLREKVCSSCGDRVTEVIPATGHKWDEPKYTWSDDYSEATASRSCLNDSNHVQKETAFSTSEITKKPTCTEPGEKTFTVGFINKAFWGQTKKIEIPATGHDFGSWNIVSEATTESAGLKERICSRCGDIEQQEIPKLNSEDPEDPDDPAPDDPAVPTVISGDVSPQNPVAADTVEKQVTTAKTDADPKGSSFNLLQAKGVAKSKNKIVVSWKKVTGAKAYIVYGNKCGKGRPYKKIKTVTGTKYTQKGLKKGTYYKYVIVAVNGSKALATSKTIHVATKGGKVGNSKALKTNAKKDKVSLKKGKKFKLTAKAIPQSKKLKVKKHRAIAFESSNPKVATVTKKGVIKGKKKGKCFVYAYTQNGVCKAIKVTVK